jgi:hypothetical protein
MQYPKPKGKSETTAKGQILVIYQWQNYETNFKAFSPKVYTQTYYPNIQAM